MKYITKTKTGIVGWLIMLIILPALFVSNLNAQEELLRVMKGKSIVLSHHEKIKAVSIADEDVADVVSITATDLVIIGKKEGNTSLIVWGESEKRREYELKVDRDGNGRQVVLEVQVAEVNKSALSEYGIDFLLIDYDDGAFIGGKKTVGSYAGGVTLPDPLSNELFIPDGVSAVLRGVGDKREISAAIRAMQKKGELKLLANPRLVSLSGEQASFLVGGEIPIPVAQTVSGTGAPTVTIEWKEYGIRLYFTPTIVDTNLINLQISPEVSNLDWTNMVSFAGYNIPALRSRKAEATVELHSGQSIVLGGLLSTETSRTERRIPILGHIPLIKFFFSRKETTTLETELLIVVSPRIIESVAEETIPPLPGQEKPEESSN